MRSKSTETWTQRLISCQLDSPEDGTITCGTELDEQPLDAVAFLDDDMLPSQSVAYGSPAITWQADIAVDTDTEWMAGKGNNTATATTWIEDLFLSMNVMYERDVNTRLLIGDVFLRIGPDPYSLDGSDRVAALTRIRRVLAREPGQHRAGFCRHAQWP